VKINDRNGPRLAPTRDVSTTQLFFSSAFLPFVFLWCLEFFLSSCGRHFGCVPMWCPRSFFLLASSPLTFGSHRHRATDSVTFFALSTPPPPINANQSPVLTFIVRTARERTPGIGSFTGSSTPCSPPSSVAVLSPPPPRFFSKELSVSSSFSHSYFLPLRAFSALHPPRFLLPRVAPFLCTSTSVTAIAAART